MKPWIKRVTLGLIVLIILLYLSLNVLVNIPSINLYFKNSIRSVMYDDVKMGYLYVNWRLRPTLQSITIQSSTTKSTQKITLDTVELSPNLSSLFSTQNALNKISIDFVRYEISGMPNSSGTAMNLPDIPVSIGEWKFIWKRNKKPVFRMGGSSIHYDGRGNHLNFPASTLQKKSVNGTISLKKQANWIGQIQLESLSLPDNLWQLQHDEWKTNIRIEPSSDSSTVHATMNGTPGEIRNISLPPVQMSLTVDASDSVTKLRKFRINSDYFESEWTGKINNKTEEININGSSELRIREQFNKILSVEPLSKLKIIRSDPLNGNFTIGGTLNNPEYNGSVNFDSASVSINLGDTPETLNLTDWKGEYTKGRIVFNRGTGIVADKGFHLKNGFLNIDKGQIIGSFTGGLEFRKQKHLPEAITALETHFGPLQSTRFPMNVSTALGPESVEMVAGLNKGQLDYKNGTFSELQFFSRLTHQNTEKSGLKGKLKDPDGNIWKFTGPYDGPIRFKTNLKRVNKWFGTLDEYLKIPKNGFTVRGATVDGILENPFTVRKRDYKIRLRSNNSKLINNSTNTNITVTGSGLLSKNLVRLDNISAKNRGSSVKTNGTIRFQNDLRQGLLDLNLRGKNLKLQNVLRDNTFYNQSVRGTVNGNFKINRTPKNPVFEGQLKDSILYIGNIKLSSLTSEINGDSETFQWKSMNTDFAGGKITGEGVIDHTDTSSIALSFKSLSFPKLFTKKSWLEQNLTGTISSTVDIKGSAIDTSTWSGTSTFKSNTMKLSKFPKIYGIKQVARVESLKEQIAFDSFDFSFPIKSGHIQHDGLKLTAEDLSISGKGVVSLEGKLNSKIDLTLKDDRLKGFLQDILGDLFRDVGLIEDEKSLTLPLKLTGTLYNPHLSVEKKKIKKNFRKNLINSLLTEELGKPVNEILDAVPFFN